MKLKKIIINTICIFVVCSLFHFIYDLFPNFLTSLFFPVNESIWEHLKMIFSASICFSLISNIFYKDKNLAFRSYIRSMASIIILLLLYIPIYYIFGEILVLTLIILFISIFLGEVIASKISEKKHYKYINIVSVLLIIINFSIFFYLTYFPIKEGLFLDRKNNKYGIDISAK